MTLTTTIQRENRGLVSDKPVQDLCVFVPFFCHFVAFGEFILQKLVTNELFG